MTAGAWSRFLRVLIVAAVALPASSVVAGTFVVNSMSDLVDTNPGDGVCNAGNGQCTLRAAIMESNALGGSNTISVPAGTYTLTIAGTGEDNAATGDLDILSSINIIGAGPSATVVQASTTSSASGIDRVFDIIPQSSGINVVISGLTIRNGNAGTSASGGGIDSEARASTSPSNVTISNCIVTGNSASRGGGLSAAGTITVSNSTISNNTATPFDGGAVWFGGANVIASIQNCTISGNTAAQNVGAVLVTGTTTATITGSTFTNNSGPAVTGVLAGDGLSGDAAVVNITNCTFSGNTAAQTTPYAVMTYDSGQSITIAFSTFANNSAGVFAPGPIHVGGSIFSNNGTTNCGGGVGLVSDGFNISSDTSCNSVFTNTGDANSTDPKIAPLALNPPGMTATHALLAGSPAINHAAKNMTSVVIPATDQRGVLRPAGNPGGPGEYDSGAYEYYLFARSDFNGDSTSDVLLQSASQVDVWQLLPATPTVAFGRVMANISSSAWGVKAAGDFNGDSRSDILAQDSTTGDVAEWQTNGTAISAGAIIGSPGTSWVPILAADFNGDGKSDVLLQNSSTKAVAMWLMDGFTVTAGAVVAAPGTAWQVKASGDVNGDGKADIVLQNTSTGDVAVWLMNGFAITGGAIVASPGTAWTLAAAGDCNGDGKADLLMQNTATGDIAEWRMNGLAITAGQIVGSPGTSWTLRGTGDYNADTKADLILRSTAGDVSVWLMNGFTITSGVALGHPGTGWDIIVR